MRHALGFSEMLSQLWAGIEMLLQFVGDRYSQQAYWVRAGNKRDQLAEVLGAFQVQVAEDDLLTRCARCNGQFFPRCAVIN